MLQPSLGSLIEYLLCEACLRNWRWLNQWGALVDYELLSAPASSECAFECSWLFEVRAVCPPSLALVGELLLLISFHLSHLWRGVC